MKTLRNMGALCVLLSGTLLSVQPVLAQDADTIRVGADTERIVIEMGDDGRHVVIDTREHDGTRRIIIDGEGHAEVIDGRRIIRSPRGPMLHVDPDGNRVRAYFRRFDMDEPFRVWFDDEDFHLDAFDLRFDHLPGLPGPEFEETMRERAEIARMDAESRRLAHRAQEAEGEERERLLRELEEQLNEIFDRKMELLEQRLERTRRELEELEEYQESRREARQEIIDRRMNELLGERDAYDW